MRNNPHAAKAVSVLVNNIVGSGIIPRAASGEDKLDTQVNALWEEPVRATLATDRGGTCQNAGGNRRARHRIDNPVGLPSDLILKIAPFFF